MMCRLRTAREDADYRPRARIERALALACSYPAQLTAPRAFEYYDILAEVESEIQEAKHLNILLVPALLE